MKKTIKMRLNTQLICLSVLIIVLLYMLVRFFVPYIMEPIYEENLYNMMDRTLYTKSDFLKSEKCDSIYIVNEEDNFYIYKNKLYQKELSDEDIINILSFAENNKGKISYKDFDYYYVNYGGEYLLTDNSYIEKQQFDFNRTFLPILIIFIAILVLILLAYSTYLTSKISKIKDAIKGIGKKEQKLIENFVIDDELNYLLNKANQTKRNLEKREEEKTKLFQQISHELKTPISIISSYMEAINDGMISQAKGKKIIDSEIKNLNNQINLILQITKMDSLSFKEEYYSLDHLIKNKIKDFNINDKFIIKYKNNCKKVKIPRLVFNLVFDNILNNFFKYAKKEIEIIVDKEGIILTNDGKKIDEKIINNIFDPYVKGKDGNTGLGLYIAKTALEKKGYNIDCYNAKNKVVFKITKKDKNIC